MANKAKNDDYTVKMTHKGAGGNDPDLFEVARLKEYNNDDGNKVKAQIVVETLTIADIQARATTAQAEYTRLNTLATLMGTLTPT